MIKWYQATCVVKLGSPLTVESGSGRKKAQQSAKGYVVVVGVSAEGIVQASSKVHKIALAAVDGNSEGNELEEMQIKGASESEIRERWELERTGSYDGKVYRSGVAFFCE